MFTEGLYGLVSTLTLICPSRLLQTSSLIWLTSLFSEHKIAVCRISYGSTLPNNLLINDAMPTSSF